MVNPEASKVGQIKGYIKCYYNMEAKKIPVKIQTHQIPLKILTQKESLSMMYLKTSESDTGAARKGLRMVRNSRVTNHLSTPLMEALHQCEVKFPSLLH